MIYSRLAALVESCKVVAKALVEALYVSAMARNCEGGACISVLSVSYTLIMSRHGGVTGPLLEPMIDELGLDPLPGHWPRAQAGWQVVWGYYV
jgi:hypothetical protein